MGDGRWEIGDFLSTLLLGGRRRVVAREARRTEGGRLSSDVGVLDTREGDARERAGAVGFEQEFGAGGKLEERANRGGMRQGPIVYAGVIVVEDAPIAAGVAGEEYAQAGIGEFEGGVGTTGEGDVRRAETDRIAAARLAGMNQANHALNHGIDGRALHAPGGPRKSDESAGADSSGRGDDIGKRGSETAEIRGVERINPAHRGPLSAGEQEGIVDRPARDAESGRPADESEMLGRVEGLDGEMLHNVILNDARCFCWPDAWNDRQARQHGVDFGERMGAHNPVIPARDHSLHGGSCRRVVLVRRHEGGHEHGSVEKNLQALRPSVGSAAAEVVAAFLAQAAHGIG